MTVRVEVRERRPRPGGRAALESRPYPALAELVEAILREHYESEAAKAQEAR